MNRKKMDVTHKVHMSVELPTTSGIEMELKSAGMTPKEAYAKYESDLSTFEKAEIFNYPEIYYVGSEAAKDKIKGGSNSNDFSCFDDNNGYYQYVEKDHLAYRYELAYQVGIGITAQVFYAVDHKEKRDVAIKVVRSQPIFHHAAKSEIEMLERIKKLKEQEDFDVVEMIDHFEFRNHICIVFEQLTQSLRAVIGLTWKQGLPLHRVQNFAGSLMKVLEALGRNKITHGDLKPDNILLKEPGKAGIKLIDFGAAFIDCEGRTGMVQALRFRAPEVILGAKFGREIDMWSVGIIIAELFTGNRFLSGQDESDQLALEMEVFGVPPPEFLKVCSRAQNFIVDGVPKYADARSMAYIRGPPGYRDLVDELKNCEDSRFVDFIRRCLTWNPKTRMTPTQALCHPFLIERIPGSDDDRLDQDQNEGDGTVKHLCSFKKL